MNQKLFHNELEYLSMGMSGDYEDAIRAGATMVRVGSPSSAPAITTEKDRSAAPMGGYYELIGRTEKVDPPLRG